MKHRNIKERRALRKEFVYKFRVEFLALQYDRERRYKQLGFTTRMNEKEKLLVEKMRQEIGYNPATIDYDIFYSSVKLLKQLLTGLYDKYNPFKNENNESIRADKKEYPGAIRNNL